MPNNVHYVKFLRGSIATWQSLWTTPNKIDDDTLYFIYDSAANVTEGKLYLGKKLISGVGGGAGNISINDIGDVYIDDQTLADKQILTYNDTTNQWENVSLSTIINTAINDFTGATSNTDGAAGLVPTPHAGDNNKFLRGDKSWATIDIPTFDSNVFQSIGNTNVITLAGFVSANVGTLPIKTSAGIEWANVTAGNISRQIITEVDLDTLIANHEASETVIYMVPSADAQSPNNYDEYMVISGAKELIGSIGNVNLDNYVTTSVFNNHVANINNILHDSSSGGVVQKGLISRVTLLETKVGDLNNLLLSDGNTTLVEEVNTLSSRLQWHEITLE